MSRAWDRLADALAPQSTDSLQLSVVTLGHVHAEDILSLTPHFQRIEQLVLDVPGRDPLAKHRAEFNRAIDAAAHDWVLIVREREVIDEALAAEIARTTAAAKARGFRICSVPFYCGRPLQLDRGEGEVRLFHRRYYVRYANKGEWQQLTIQGTVVRLENVLRSVSFDSEAAHRDQLGRTAVRHSTVRRLLLFIGYALGARTLDGNTLRYLWIEAGFDHG